MNSIARQLSNRLSASTGMSESHLHPAHRSQSPPPTPGSTTSSLSGASNSSRLSKISQSFSTWSRESKNNLKTFAVSTPWVTGVPSAETYKAAEEQYRRRKSSSYFPSLGGQC